VDSDQFWRIAITSFSIGLMVAVKPWLKRSLPIGARRLGVIVGRFISPLLRRAR
jgi:hypothetical protein